MLDEGTTTRSTLKIAEDLDQLGAHVHTDGSLDSNVVSLSTLKKTLTPALDIFSDVALNPAFDSKEVDRLRNERVTSIKQDKDNPSILARRALRRTHCMETKIHMVLKRMGPSNLTRNSRVTISCISSNPITLLPTRRSPSQAMSHRKKLVSLAENYFPETGRDLL